jgi:hypothetical protein
VTSSHRIQTSGVTVEIRIGAQSMRGELFLHEASGAHLGAETVEDLMNDETPFFPLRVTQGGSRTVLIGKQHVLYVIAPPMAADARVALERDTGVSFEVTLELSDEESVSGILYGEQRPGKQRPLDVLNAHAQRFITLVQAGRDCLVNRSKIRVVRDTGSDGVGE